MPVDRAKKIIERLEATGFIRAEFIEGRRHYVLTARGSEFLELYRRLKALLAFLEP